MAQIYKATYYPWITQNIDPKIIQKSISSLLVIVEHELNVITGVDTKIELLPTLEVPQQMKTIINGECQIAFMNPLGFIYANQVNPEVRACSVVERKINGQWGTKYITQVYTNKKTGIKPDIFSLEKSEYQKILKGKSIGFGSPFSTSNFIVPSYELVQKGIKVLTSFNRLEFLGGHELVAKAVYEGKVDLGAGHDGAILDLSNQYGFGDAEEKLVQLLKADIPSDPIAINVTDGEELKHLRIAFENASKTKEGEQAIKTFWGGARHLLPIETEVYKYLIDAASKLNLSREDIFEF